MARVTFINAIMRGKLGGSVYSSNKGGAIVRQFVKPSNPQTPAQMQARATFTTAVSAYAALSALYQQGWNTFALNGFSPKHPKTGVTYSGYNAFVALTSEALNAKALKSATDPTVSIPAAATLTLFDFEQPVSPPVGAMSAQIQNSTGTIPISVALDSFVYTSGGTSVLTLNLDGGGGLPLTTAPNFKDYISKTSVGYVVYGSTPIATAQMQPKKTELFAVGIVPPINAVTGWTSGNQIAFDLSAVKNVGTSKFSYVTGQYAKFTVYAVNKSGQMQLIGSTVSEIL